jgi:hypothetical protein
VNRNGAYSTSGMLFDLAFLAALAATDMTSSAAESVAFDPTDISASSAGSFSALAMDISSFLALPTDITFSALALKIRKLEIKVRKNGIGNG